MLMEGMLNKSLFSRQQTSLVKEEGYSSTHRIGRMTILGKGSATWSKYGEWIEGNSLVKERLILSEDPKTFIALQENRPNLTWYETIRGHLTHVKVKGKKGECAGITYSVNIGSLSLRTHLSFLTIILMRLTGRLTLEAVEQRVIKASERSRVFDLVIENGRKRAAELGVDPESKIKELKDVLQTVLKSSRLAKGIFIKRGDSCYVAHTDRSNRFTLEEKRELLGEGTYGSVFEVCNIATGEVRAFKIAKQADKKSGIINENAILNLIHKNAHVTGLQNAPHFALNLMHRTLGWGYVAKKYDFNLNNMNFLKLTPMGAKLEGTKELFHGVKHLHENGFVHCDIKPANCCLDNGEFQIADFGHARLCENVSPEQPLGVFTPYFTSETDEHENTRIALAYSMNNLARGKIKTLAARAWILQSAINHPTFAIDKKAAKITLAALLMKLSNDKIVAMGIDLDLFKDDLEEMKKNPREMKTQQLDLSKFMLTMAQLEQLKKNSVALCKQHDVYSLAVTLLCIYLGHQFIRPERIEVALRKLAKHSDMTAVNPGLVKLLKLMLCKNGAKRPSIKQAYERYLQLINPVRTTTSA